MDGWEGRVEQKFSFLFLWGRGLFGMMMGELGKFMGGDYDGN